MANIFHSTAESEFDDLAHRVSDLEVAVHKLQDLAARPGSALADRAYSPFPTGGVGDYNDLSGMATKFVPWMTTAARFQERLTSTEFVWATLGQAVIAGLSFTILGAGAAWLLELPWLASPVIGVTCFALAGSVLVLHNRLMLQRMIAGQAERQGRRRSELRVQIDKIGDHSIEFLYLNSDVKPWQLKEFARAALDGANLGVHKWTGEGALFRRGQFDDLMTELEKMGYMNPSRGPTARQLTAKGRALFKALAV